MIKKEGKYVLTDKDNQYNITSCRLLTRVTLEVTFHHSGEPLPRHLLPVDPPQVLLDV